MRHRRRMPCRKRREKRWKNKTEKKVENEKCKGDGAEDKKSKEF